MSNLVVETHQHEVTHIGFTADKRVVITFDNGPFDGELILDADVFRQLHEQWSAFCEKAE